VTALVAMAAHIEGKGCATLNQTGLAQKFGAVVSHVRVSSMQEDIKAVRIPAGEADLLLGCDLAVTSSYEALGKAADGRTHAVVNEAEVPTSAFIHDPDTIFPTDAMQDKIRSEAGENECHFVDATAIATALLGNSIAANLFLLGFAWQRGLVAVGSSALEQAIELNAVAVEFNKRAFQWGRRFAHQPAQVLLAAGLTDSQPAPLDLDAVIADRSARLTQYQNANYAQRFRQLVARIREADPRATDADSLTMQVARNLYKLMAYKDEYEVARLYSDPAFIEGLREQFDGDFSLRFNMAPPLFSKKDPLTGHARKREFGPWMMMAFRMLAQFKGLRGTAFDVFGYSAERHQERLDIAEYESLIDDVRAYLNSDNYDTACALAALPAKLRGYGHVKDNNREKLAPQREQLLQQLKRVPGSTVRIFEAA
ncbi:MAG: DUF6537 domain-containing protein, partial [Pseudomonadota bacterium]